MHRRTIIINTTSDKLDKVINRLSTSSPVKVSVTIDMEETKDNYKYLAKNSDIDDWDFVGEDAQENKKDDIDLCSDPYYTDPSINPAIIAILKDAKINIYEPSEKEVLLVIKSIWETKNTYKNINYSLPNISRAIDRYCYGNEYFEYKLNNEESVLESFIAGYNSVYSGSDRKNIYNDLFDSIKKVWNDIASYSSLTEFVSKIYDVELKKVE